MSLFIRYNPKLLAANSTTSFSNTDIHGLGAFLATAPGSITITDGNGNTLLSAFPLVAGQRLELTMYVQTNSCTITLAGGAAGTLLYW